MINRILLFSLLILIPFSFAMAGPNLSPVTPADQTSEVGTTKLKEKVDQINAKQKKRMEKRLNFLKEKLAKEKFAKKGDSTKASPVRVGLVVILIGALLAVLGLAGVADLLISIGVIVLVVGLIFWLLGLLL
jgi:Flp pilus assembly protein TadB